MDRKKYQIIYADRTNQLDLDPKFHFTDELMVRDLISLIPFASTDSVLDAGSGKNKVWFNNIPVKDKYECEILDGLDFFDWNAFVDWVIGNPPFASNERVNGKRTSLIPKWIDKSSCIARKGMAFLVNYKCFNSLTPVKLERLRQRGFTIKHIHIVSDKRWYGRYFFIIFTRDNSTFIGWEKKSYGQ